MAHLKVEVDGTELFNDNVDGWNPPPALPDNPNVGPGIQGLPAPVRAALAKALEKAMTKATGFKVHIET